MRTYTCGSCLQRYTDRQSQVCPHDKRTPRTQVSRLVMYLRSHPGASGMEIIAALALPKYTSRISDARAAGFDIVCIKRGDGVNGYRLVERPVQLEAFG